MALTVRSCCCCCCVHNFLIPGCTHYDALLWKYLYRGNPRVQPSRPDWKKSRKFFIFHKTQIIDFLFPILFYNVLKHTIYYPINVSIFYIYRKPASCVYRREFEAQTRNLQFFSIKMCRCICVQHKDIVLLLVDGKWFFFQQFDAENQ
jgi:hypothetical protein